MGLKRKRSSPAFSSPLSDSSDATTSSSPLPFFYTQSKPVEPLYQKPTWSFPTYDEGMNSQYLNSRTRKRHRDNRPDEEIIHGELFARTLGFPVKAEDVAEYLQKFLWPEVYSKSNRSTEQSLTVGIAGLPV